MFIFIDWVLMTILTGLFLLVYFVDIRVKSMQTYSNLRISQHIEYVFDGVLYGGLFVFFYIMFDDISFNNYMFVIAGIFLTLTKDYRVSLMALIAPLLFAVSTEELVNTFYVSLGMVYSFILVQVIAAYFVDFPFERRISLSILFICSIILMTTFSILWDDPYSVFISVLLPVIMGIYSYLIISYSIRTSESANALYKTINYTFSNYYRNTMKERAILEITSRHKIKYGIYCLLDIKIDNYQSKQHKNEIFESVLLDFEKIVPNNTLLFKSNEYYGFFIPKEKLGNLPAMISGNYNLTRTNIDNLLEVQKIIEQIPSSYRTTTSSVNDVKVNAGVSLYGIQNQSISDLDAMAEYALKISNTKRDNIVKVFEPKSYRKRVKDSEELKNLNIRIGLDNFDIEYEPIYSIDNKVHQFTLGRQKLTSDSMTIPSIDKYKKFHRATRTFDRYFAASAVKKYSNYETAPLVIRYSPVILDDTFDIDEFIVFIDRQNVEPSGLIIEFLDTNLNDVSNKDVFLSNIKKLKEYGIKFAVTITLPERINLIIDVAPILLIFNSVELSRKTHYEVINMKRVILNISTESHLNKAKYQGIEYFSGTLIEIKS